jgi:DNA-binding NtrC family response regulator
MLAAYDWHRNNVRELRNVVERLIIAAGDDDIRADHIPPRSSIAATGQPIRQLRSRPAAPRPSAASSSMRSTATTGTSPAPPQELGLADHASLLKIMRRLGIAYLTPHQRIANHAPHAVQHGRALAFIGDRNRTRTAPTGARRRRNHAELDWTDGDRRTGRAGGSGHPAGVQG